MNVSLAEQTAKGVLPRTRDTRAPTSSICSREADTMADSGDLSIAVRRARIDSLVIYEVTAHELEALSKDSPSDIYLNFAIFLLSTATSFLITLTSTDVSSNRTFTIFVVVAVIGYSLGSVLLCLWWRSRASSTFVAAEIKKRFPPDHVCTS
jgi:hypothetical protein